MLLERHRLAQRREPFHFNDEAAGQLAKGLRQVQPERGDLTNHLIDVHVLHSLPHLGLAALRDLFRPRIGSLALGDSLAPDTLEFLLGLRLRASHAGGW